MKKYGRKETKKNWEIEEMRKKKNKKMYEELWKKKKERNEWRKDKK